MLQALYALATFAALTPTVRLLEGKEARQACIPVANLCAEAILAATDANDRAVLSAALQRDLLVRVTTRESGALLLAEDEEGGVVACCALSCDVLSPTALDRRRASADAVLTERPFLSSLAVAPSFRKRGLAKTMCRRAEELARSWGYDEMLLKVERDNSRAQRLYRKLGYRVVATDWEAERPEAQGGAVQFVPTTQVAYRKDLRYAMPPDTAAVYAATATAALATYATNEALLQRAALLVTHGEIVTALNALSALALPLPPALLQLLPV
jgi:ribosomal protein S18 acetylase RimI-like enzyme